MSGRPGFKNRLSQGIRQHSKNVLLTILLSGCLAPTEIKTNRDGNIIIVSGQLSNLPDQSALYVGVTADIERLPFPVTAAIVNLFEGDEFAGTYIEDTTTPGKYILLDYVGIPGKVYHVQIMLPDNRMYESVPEKMPDDSGSVSAYYQIENEEFIDNEAIIVNQPVVKIFSNSILPTSDNRFLKWKVEEVFILIGGSPGPFTPPPCFVTQLADPQYIVLLDRRNLAGTEYPDKFLATRVVDYSFMLKHYFVTYQSAITKDAFDYWRKVEILVGQNGSLFDTPPAKISGNIRSLFDPSEKVFGYFEATHQTLHRFFLTKDDFPFTMNYNDCSGNDNTSGQVPLRCSNCLTIRNSSHVRPPWF